MKINDIVLYQNRIFAIIEVTYSAEYVENVLASYSYSGEGLMRDSLVEDAKLPPFTAAFYKKLFLSKKLPSEKDFLDFYLKDNAFKIVDQEYVYNNEYYSIPGVHARALRTYPSIVRDFHFYLLCRDSGRFDKVVYSLKDDISNGIDLEVTYQGKKYQIMLRVQTKLSDAFRKRKNVRTANALEMIDMPLNLSNAKKVGQYYIYDNGDIDLLISKITQKLEESGE